MSLAQSGMRPQRSSRQVSFWVNLPHMHPCYTKQAIPQQVNIDQTQTGDDLPHGSVTNYRACGFNLGTSPSFPPTTRRI